MWPDMWAAIWLPLFRPTNAPQPLSARDRVLSRTRHPSFSAEVAEHLVCDLSHRQLLELWDESTTLLGQRLPLEVRFNVVVLRDHLLHRLEGVAPHLVEVCLRTGRPSRSRRPTPAKNG